MTNNKLTVPKDIFSIGKDIKDIKDDTKSDITQDINDTNDITIEVNNDYETAKSTIILRLKPSTVNALDEIAYKARKSRNYIAQKLLDQAIAKVKLK